MSKRGLGLVLVLTFAAAISVAVVFEDFRIDDLAARDRASSDIVNRTLQSTQLSLAALRGAQAAYVAVGQGPDFWFQRGRELAAQIETNLGQLQAISTSADAKVHYEAAVSALGVLNGLDQKARDDLAEGDRALAAEVIFADATTAAGRLSAELSAAQWAEAASDDLRSSLLRRRRLATTGGGVAALLMLALVLATRRRRVLPARPDVQLRPEAPVEAAPVAPAAAAPRINLADAAQVCVDLARVLDGHDVPPLLERAARVLDAKGLVLWVADSGGATLLPSLAHGYSEKVLQRLGPLQTTADNVTSLAFRSMQPQTLSNRAKGANNAFAIPLVTPAGCIGVLSAEVPEEGTGPETVSIAKIFAAQLATLVTPAEASAPKTAQA